MRTEAQERQPIWESLSRGTSRHASGYPGSLDHLTPVYGITILLVTFFSAWPVSNNAAIFAEVWPPRTADLAGCWHLRSVVNPCMTKKKNVSFAA